MLSIHAIVNCLFKLVVLSLPIATEFLKESMVVRCQSILLAFHKILSTTQKEELCGEIKILNSVFFKQLMLSDILSRHRSLIRLEAVPNSPKENMSNKI